MRLTVSSAERKSREGMRSESSTTAAIMSKLARMTLLRVCASFSMTVISCPHASGRERPCESGIVGPRSPRPQSERERPCESGIVGPRPSPVLMAVAYFGLVELVAVPLVHAHQMLGDLLLEGRHEAGAVHLRDRHEVLDLDHRDITDADEHHHQRDVGHAVEAVPVYRRRGRGVPWVRWGSMAYGGWGAPVKQPYMALTSATLNK